MMFYSYLWGKHCWLKMEWSLCVHNYVPKHWCFTVVCQANSANWKWNGVYECNYVCKQWFWPLFANRTQLIEKGIEFMSVNYVHKQWFWPLLAKQAQLTENWMEWMRVIMCINNAFYPCLPGKHGWLKMRWSLWALYCNYVHIYADFYLPLFV